MTINRNIALEIASVAGAMLGGYVLMRIDRSGKPLNLWRSELLVGSFSLAARLLVHSITNVTESK